MQKNVNMAKIQRSLEMNTEMPVQKEVSHEAVIASNRKIRSTSTYDYLHVTSPEKSHLKPSKTVPDLNMSIPEIIRRFASGLPLPKNDLVEIYDEEDEYPDFKAMDLSEQHDYAEDLANRARSKAKADNNRYPMADSGRLPGSGQQASEPIGEQFPPSAAEEQAPRGN